VSKVHDQLRRYVDGRDNYMAGFQIGEARTYRRKLPAWTNNNSETRRVLLAAFPELHTNQRQRHQAARWAQVITLCFHLRYTAKQAGEEMGVPPSTISGIVQRIRRVAAGYRANGCGKRGGKRGRPSKANKMVFNNTSTYVEVYAPLTRV
jgi:DNA-directed RNA polymerase specialized sigma24 family protein